MSGRSFSLSLAVGGQLKRFDVGAAEPVRIGFLAPLSGPAQSWGLPGLMGARIWVDWINDAGGLIVGGRRHPVELADYDCASGAEAAVAGARQLVQDQGVRLMLMLGGDTFRPVARYLTDRKILTSTMLPSDLSPDTPYLIAPSEIHPLYNVTAVDWLARHQPAMRRVALCSQNDAVGLPSLATYRAAFKAAGISVVKEIRYDPAEQAAEPMLTAMLAENPDILCWCTSYQPMVHALTEAAHQAGYRGQILSCTADNYPRLIARTSQSFMEGFLFQFPDFDDPSLRDGAFFFNRPAAFYAEYNRRFPGAWSAVSWEYAAALDLWHSAVEKAGTVAPVSVLAAMKRAGRVDTVFGDADWAGQDMFGIDNALVGQWPVVRIGGGKARIVAFGSISDWLARHGDLLKAEMHALGQMWHQRQARAD
ncbi:MAG TPA: ABC transporter substrate-binding protein [Paracoccaceae bacterium]|nr:ABC transporter substrate-binding protein [Paracoccaceae bacterium]